MPPLEHYRPTNADAAKRIAEAYVATLDKSTEPEVADVVKSKRDAMVALLQKGIEQGFILLRGRPLDDVGGAENIPIQLSFAPLSPDALLISVAKSEIISIPRGDVIQSTRKDVRTLRKDLFPPE